MALPSITWADVTAVAPEVASAGAATQEAILARVDREVVHSALTERYLEAKAYLAAHLATQTASAGAAGPVAAESVDGVSVSYAVTAAVRALTSTGYGQEYLRILETTAGLRMAELY